MYMCTVCVECVIVLCGVNVCVLYVVCVVLCCKGFIQRLAHWDFLSSFSFPPFLEVMIALVYERLKTIMHMATI